MSDRGPTASCAITSVTLTGTGIPHPTPGRAGASALVRHGEIALLFDAGRGTVIRLAEAGVSPLALDAVFVTHAHSDHLVDLADVAMTRWILQQVRETGPLSIVAAEGCAARFARRMLEPYDDDIAVRMAHVNATAPRIDLRAFAAPAAPTRVWRSACGTVGVEAVAIHHEPVVDAVAYRITTPNGVVVISGDTRVCAEVEALAAGADILVHEACRSSALAATVKGSVFEKIFGYHADTVALGGLAKRAGVRHLLLTHLIPSPTNPEQEEAFVLDVRKGGYDGRMSVGRDGLSAEIGGRLS